MAGITRKDLVAAKKRKLVTKDEAGALLGERWTCTTCGRAFRSPVPGGRPRLFGCGHCSFAYEGLSDRVARSAKLVAGARVVLAATGQLGTIEAMEGEGTARCAMVRLEDDAEGPTVLRAVTELAPILNMAVEHVGGCGHAPSPFGNGSIKEGGMAEKFKPKAKKAETNPLVEIFLKEKGATVEEALAALHASALRYIEGVSDDEAREIIKKFLASGAAEAGYKVLVGKGEAAGRYRLLVNSEKEGGMKTVKAKNGRKAAGKASTKSAASPKTEKTKRPGVIAAMLQLISEKERTKEEVVAALKKIFPDRAEKGMSSTFNIQIGGSKPQQAERGHKITSHKKDGVVYFKAVLAKSKA